jgi:NAD(P)-dependent dehydrogenase (short-subunit alcohol dehydrogenase family)
MRDLTDKVVVLVGGAGFIGTATSKRLAEEGAVVVVGDLDLGSAQTVRDEIQKEGGRASAARVDITDEASVAALMTAAEAEHGGVDCMHVNAMDFSPETMGADTDAVDVAMDVFDRTMAAGLRGYLLCTRHAVPAMLRRGGGCIIYTCSAAAYNGEATRVCYGMAKIGITALVRHVAARWGKEGIRANAVSPGLVPKAYLPGEFRDYVLGLTKSDRLGYPADIAAMVAMLMSSDGEWVNGQIVAVDGGLTLRA